MKRLVFLWVCILAVLLTFFSVEKLEAQTYGNEWINYSQSYFKFKVRKEGIYRINYTTLVQAGVPIGTFDPRGFQLFSRGEEQHIFVKNESTGLFSQGDYIEFYANHNDGWFDGQLYNTPGTHANPYYSLFNDTATYYLTWNNTLSNRRLTIEEDETFINYSPMPYFWAVNHQNYTNEYFYGETNDYGSTDAEYVTGEGWFNDDFVMGGSITKGLLTPNFYASGPAATLTTKVIGASMPVHHLNISMPGHVIDTMYSGYKVLTFSRQIPANLLTTSGIAVTFASVNNPNSTADRSTFAYLRLKYPQLFSFSNSVTARMYLPDAQGQSKALLNISNFYVAANDTALLYDITNNKKIKVVKSGSVYKALVPNAGGEKLCFLSSTGQLNYVVNLMPVNTSLQNFARFTDFSEAPHNQSDYLIITHKLLMAEAEQYRDYRNSTGYTVLIADIDELYDQFAYGIVKHPLSIRNFALFAYNNFQSPPNYMFLLGKSLNAKEYRSSSAKYAKTLVPTFGVPCSDNLFTSRIIDTLYQPAIATGRLAAQNGNHVLLYLNKVQEYEGEQALAQQNPPLWMKNVLHFGGGGNTWEQNQIAAHLMQFENTIEDTLFGAYVRTFLKTSTAPIQINQSDSLKDIINNGVSLMTFFGHASGTGFDQSIDNPVEYNNAGKYPFLFANSCYAGDIFTDVQSSSEAFVLIPNKGVIGYLASTAPSPVSSLQVFGNAFYKQISALSYGQPVGQCIRKTIEAIQTTTIGNPFIKEVCLVSVLHGDPAIKLNYFPKPDFEVTTASIYYTPEQVTTEIDSFDVNIIITNKGSAVNGHFVVELQRLFPDNNTTTTYLQQIPATLYKDTVSFKLPVDIALGVGINKLQVTLDLYNAFDEITKVNNVVNVNLFIKSLDIIPVYPAKYAVIPAPNVTLKASTGNPFSTLRNYIFQIDTTDVFDSPFLTTHQVAHGGGVVTWTLPFTLTDSTVYYWRVALDNNQQVWRESSFQYIQGKSGWGQAHYFQFKEDFYQYVTYNRPDRDYIFVNNYKILNVQTGIHPNLEWDEHWYKINGAVMDIWSCLWDWGNGMKFAVFNPTSGLPWYSTEVTPGLGPYYNEHCKIYDVPAFDFFTHTESWRNRIKAFIDTVPDGYYILAYNHRDHYAQQYNESLLQAFESFGSASIRILQNNTPYIIFGKKGDPIGYANEVIGSSSTQTIQLTDSIKTAWNEGFVKSEVIGPASKWNSIHWRYFSKENFETDSVRLSVIGIKLSGQEDVLMSGISSDSLDILNISSVINAQEYPYLQLVAHMKDDSMHTPAQLKRWHVLFDEVPETALNPSAHFHFYKDTLQQGEELVFSCAIQNIGNIDMDSLLVAYWIIDKDRNYIPINYPRQRPHPVGDVFIDTVTFSTANLSGLNSLWIEANPNFDQLEQYSFNNIGEMPFYVNVDKINPLLDVTFDGVHILDGDIVSANPVIQVVLRDENQYLAINDTTLFRLYLKKPGMAEGERVYFKVNGQDIILFFPASLPDNVARLEYRPGLLPDGTYELKVQARDVSQNVSGFYDYTINFKVVNKPSVTEVLNYPNPFSTSTRFVFTLTGSRLPDYMKIQIMTISGKIVKEIDMTELGNIHIGRNITSYAWDGTDMYGDRLANGVYLYRVVTRIDDKAIELNQTSASKYFNHEFGKMYLFR